MHTVGVNLLEPANLLLVVLNLGLLVLAVVAFADCVRRPAGAFLAAGKLTKGKWLGITGVSVALCLVGVGILGILGAAIAVGCIVYLVDVRPAVSGMRPGGGPYG